MTVPSVARLAGSLEPAGRAADHIEALWWLMFWLGLVVLLVVLALLGLGLRRRPDEGLETPGGSSADSESAVRRWIVWGGVVVPLAVLVVVFVATVAVMRATPSADQVPGARVIEVVGSQFHYDVTYPDAQVTVRDELRLPVGEPVVLVVTSTDVIHSFWVPELGGKIDMLPDGRNTMVVEAERAGTFTARCAEFCGTEHTRMTMPVRADPAEQFAAWLEAQR